MKTSKRSGSHNRKCVNDYELIPDIQMSKDELAEKIVIIQDGSKFFTYYADRILGLRKREEFRKRFFAGEFQDCLPSKHVKKMLAVKDVEWPILCQYAKLCFKRAEYWCNKCFVAGSWEEHFQDLYQEAIIALQRAIYSFVNHSSKASFFTFAYRSINSRLVRVVENLRAPMLPPSADGARELVKQYWQIIREMNGPTTFDEICEHAGWDINKSHIVAQSLSKIINECELIDKSDDESSNIEESGATSMERLGGVVIDNQPKINDLHEMLQSCIRIAKLTDFQHDLIFTYMNGMDSRGWKSEIAKKHNVTRQASYEAFRDACDKLRRAYQKLS